MRVGKSVAGLLLITLGVIGIIACLAGMGGVWIGASRLQQLNAKVFGDVERVVALVDQKAARAGKAAKSTRDLADELRETLRETAKKAAQERLASAPEVEDLQQRLASAMQNAEGLLELSASAAELFEQVAGSVDSLSTEEHAASEASSQLLSTIRSTQDALAHASDALADVGRRLDEMRQNQDAEGNAEQIKQLSLAIISRLDVVQQQLNAFRERLEEARSGLTRLRSRIETWIFLGRLVLLFLLVWIGAGQYCLLVQGWRVHRRPQLEADG